MCSMTQVKTAMLGSLQAKIMNVLWKANKPLKPAEVLTKLGDDYAYTTVMTILKRLTEKNIVKREFKGKVYFYFPVFNRQHFVETNLKDIYGDLVDSYGKVAISQFVDTIKNNREDMAALKEYIESN